MNPPEQARPLFADNPAYVQCQRLLKELQELMARGAGDSERADAIRDAMEATRDRLAPEESRRIEELSADLYMLTDEEIFQDASAERRATLPQMLRQAFYEKRYEDVLTLLRCGPAELPREQIAYFRGRCWDELRDYEPAAWFFQYALDLAPENPNYAALVLGALERAGRQSTAVERAHSIVSDRSAHPRVLFTAARILFRRAEQLEETAARPVYEMVVHAVEQALQKEATLPASERIPSLTFAGHVGRALALERLGRESEARQAYLETIRAYPRSSEILTLAGLFELRVGESQAAPYFEKAVELNARHVLPYLFLSHHRLKTDRFQEVIDLCQSGIQYAKRYEDLAQFHEWSAIARYALGDPDQTVQDLFNAAIAFDPLNFRIRRNRDAFEKFIADRPAGSRFEFEASPLPDSREEQRALGASVMRERAA